MGIRDRQRSQLRHRCSRIRYILYFFFQAEDGIRDGRVTGVQTCALPICLNSTYIKQYLSDNGLQQFQVYNIAKNGAGNPSQQIQYLEPMVSSHPTVIVYGLGFRELGYKPYTNNVPSCAPGASTPFEGNTTNTSFSTPSVQDAASYLQKIIPVKVDYFSNLADPKHVTVDLLKSYLDRKSVV